jgi:hypothetical protein
MAYLVAKSDGKGGYQFLHLADRLASWTDAEHATRFDQKPVELARANGGTSVIAEAFDDEPKAEPAAEQPKSDGVNREGLDYRAGWIEALVALSHTLNVEALRAKPSNVRGLQTALTVAKKQYEAMIAKMKGGE